MNRIEEINNELKIIDKCQEIYLSKRRKERNGLNAGNSQKLWEKEFDRCLGLSSDIIDMESLKIYKLKIQWEKSYLLSREEKKRWSSDLMLPLYDKFEKYLSKNYKGNKEERFNQHVANLKL